MNSDTVHSLGKLLLRLAVGGLMLCHGIHKLMHGLEPIKKMLVAHHLPAELAYGVPVGEVFAPLLLILGVWSRLAGLTVAFTMGMAIYLAFGMAAVRLDGTGGLNAELPLLFLFASLAIVCLGSGRFSVNGGGGSLN